MSEDIAGSRQREPVIEACARALIEDGYSGDDEVEFRDRNWTMYSETASIVLGVLIHRGYLTADCLEQLKREAKE